jgi:hypothetical protein
MKIENRKIAAGPTFQLEAHHYWPGPAAQWPNQPTSADDARVLDVASPAA